MDIAQIQAMHAYIQHLQNIAAPSTTTTNLLTTPKATPLSNSTLMNSVEGNNLNSLALAFLYANQTSAANNQQVHQQQQFVQQPQVSVPLPSTFHQQQQQQSHPSSIPPQMYNPNVQLNELQNQLEQQAILTQLSQLISFGQSQTFSPQAQPSQAQPQHTVFQQQQQFQQQPSASQITKPPTLIPSQPIQIPKPQASQQSMSLKSSITKTPENIRKRSHKIISQPSSQSGSPNNNNSNIEKLSRSRALTCSETMKPAVTIKKEPVDRTNPSPDKIAKFDPSCPQRHHPDNMEPPNRQALMLEQLTTAYILHAIGESNACKSLSQQTTKDENLSNEEIEDLKDEKEEVFKIPVSEIHRMIEDCYNDL